MDHRASLSLAIDALDMSEQALGALDDRLMDLVTFTDLLVAEGHEVTNETKTRLLRVLTLLRSVRGEMLALKDSYHALRVARRSIPS